MRKIIFGAAAVWAMAGWLYFHYQPSLSAMRMLPQGHYSGYLIETSTNGEMTDGGEFSISSDQDFLHFVTISPEGAREEGMMKLKFSANGDCREDRAGVAEEFLLKGHCFGNHIQLHSEAPLSPSEKIVTDVEYRWEKGSVRFVNTEARFSNDAKIGLISKRTISAILKNSPLENSSSQKQIMQITKADRSMDQIDGSSADSRE